MLRRDQICNKLDEACEDDRWTDIVPGQRRAAFAALRSGDHLFRSCNGQLVLESNSTSRILNVDYRRGKVLPMGIMLSTKSSGVSVVQASSITANLEWVLFRRQTVKRSYGLISRPSGKSVLTMKIQCMCDQFLVQFTASKVGRHGWYLLG